MKAAPGWAIHLGTQVRLQQQPLCCCTTCSACLCSRLTPCTRCWQLLGIGLCCLQLLFCVLGLRFTCCFAGRWAHFHPALPDVSAAAFPRISTTGAS
jgi:hypothetical protein